MANKTMKTLTINNNTYEVVDSTARSSVTEAKTIANEAKSLANDAKSAATTATQTANNMSSDVSTAKSDISTLKTNVTNINTKIGDLNSLNTTAKNNLVAAINEAMTKGGSGEGGGGGGLTEVSWEDVKNKPFGDVTPIIWEVDPNAEPDPNADGMIRIGDAPESVELLCGGALVGTDGVSTQIYTEIIDDISASEDIPAEYGAVIINGSLLGAPDGMYMIYTNPIAGVLMFVCTKDVNDEELGLTLPAGMYVDPARNISQVVGIKVTKIPSIFLPPIDDGAGAFVLNLTSMTDQDGNPIILTSGTSISVSDADSPTVSAAVSAAIAGKPLIVKAYTSVTGSKIVQMTGSVTIEDVELLAVYISGIFGDLDSLSDIYKFNIGLATVSSYATVVPYITPILDGLPSPASNIKYLDFGDETPDLEAINFSEFHAGDLILCLTNLT